MVHVSCLVIKYDNIRGEALYLLGFVKINKLESPRLINTAGNPGIADYS